MLENSVILLDIGGTKTRVGISPRGGTLSEYKVTNTPQHYEEGLATIIAMANSLLKGKKPRAAIVGIAGPIDQKKGELHGAPNLPNWSGKPLKSALATMLACPVFLENDTALVGLGEAVKGAGKEYKIVAYITASTGVNGVKIVNRKIDQNSHGFEIGHQIIDIDNSLKRGSSGKGELEDFLSGREVEKRYMASPERIGGENVWGELAHYLAIGVHNTIVYWSPEIVVLGGSLMKSIALSDVKTEVEKLNVFPRKVEIVKGLLGDTAGMEGGLHYASSIKI